MAYTDVADDYTDESQQQQPQADPLTRLQQLAKVPNLAIDNDIFQLTPDKLTAMGQKVCRETRIDESSRAEWEKRVRAGMDLALQNAKPKTFPWPGAANVRFPIMTSAAIQFAARAYPAIIMGAKVVRCEIMGADPGGTKKARGERICAHMSWQLLKRMKEWESDVDRMMHAIPIIGCGFKKTFFSPDLGRPRSDYVSAFDLIVNHSAKSLATAPRVTHCFELYPHEIAERILSGTFRSFDYGIAEGGGDDEDAPHKFLEQHRRWDLDGDGYTEPYIITVHKQTQQVCRVRANWDADTIRMFPGKIVGIDPVEYFTKIPFVPNPDGGFYDIGFGWLLSPLNESINTVINQLLDAGTLANTGGGFIGSGLRLKGGTLRFSPGEYKEVDVSGSTARDNVVPLTFPGPSPVLFQLLGLLIDAAREVASVKDVLTGEVSAQTMQPGTALALIEQGLKVFTSIFKRIHRGLGEEYQKLYAINRKYFDQEEYEMFQDAPQLSAEDYQGDPMDIVPVSDPSMVADMQRIARAEYLERYKGQPGMNTMAITRRQLESVGVENIEELFEQQKAAPPEALAALARLTAEIEETYSKIDLNKARVIESIARAEAEEPGQQLEAYKIFFKAMADMRKPQGEGGKPAGPMPQPPPQLGGPPIQPNGAQP
jgi:chaperonin GroES